jgi:hypothetical protein
MRSKKLEVSEFSKKWVLAWAGAAHVSVTRPA